MQRTNMKMMRNEDIQRKDGKKIRVDTIAEQKTRTNVTGKRL